MNIAVVGACPYPVPQGSQVYLRETALAWREAGHHVRLVTYGYGQGDDGSELPLDRARNLPFAQRTAAGPSIAKPLQDALLLQKLREVIRDHRINVVNAHNYEALAVALAAGRRPIIYHAHNALHDELPHYFPFSGVAAAVGRWFDATLPERADLVVTPHDRLRASLIASGCREDRVHTIPPPIPISGSAPMPCGNPVLLYAGNLDRYQNVEIFDPVMRRIRSAVPDAQLVIATGESRTKALLRAAELGRVLRAPTLAVALAALPGGAIFLCPRVSWSGYPIKLLNAMAAGLPIVSFQSAGHPFTPDRDALIVSDGDIEAFSNAAIRLLRDAELRASLGAAARNTAEARHARKAVAPRLDALLQNLSVSAQ